MHLVRLSASAFHEVQGTIGSVGASSVIRLTQPATVRLGTAKLGGEQNFRFEVKWMGEPPFVGLTHALTLI